MLWPELMRYERLWQPWREMQYIHNEMNRLMEGITVPYSANFPEVNIWEAEEDVIVTAEIPGVDPNRIEISVKGETLMISGYRIADELKEGEFYHRQERSHGNFSKLIEVPFHINATKVEANYENGILKLTLPRSEEEKKKKIEIKTPRG